MCSGPVMTRISVMPAPVSFSKQCMIIGLLPTGIRCLLFTRLTGDSREPVTPARMTPLIVFDMSPGSFRVMAFQIPTTQRQKRELYQQNLPRKTCLNGEPSGFFFMQKTAYEI